MLESFKKSLLDYSFRGRSTRNEYLYFIFVVITIGLFVLALLVFIGNNILCLKYNTELDKFIIPYQTYKFGLFPLILYFCCIMAYQIFIIYCFIMSAFLSIRRLHDINCSGVGYWIWVSALIALCISTSGIFTGILLYFVIGGIIALSIMPSYEHENKYGRPEEIISKLEKSHG